MQFNDGKYLTAKAKANIAKAFERYILSGFKREKFTRALYQHLSLHFGFIAHFDADGFHGARFADPVGRLETLDRLVNASRWTFLDENTSGTADLNTAIRNIALKYSDFISKSALADRRAYLAENIDRMNAELAALGGAKKSSNG